MDADKEKSCKREKMKNSEKVGVGVFKEGGGAEDSKLNLGGVNKSGCSDRNLQWPSYTLCHVLFICSSLLSAPSEDKQLSSHVTSLWSFPMDCSNLAPSAIKDSNILALANKDSLF